MTRLREIRRFLSLSGLRGAVLSALLAAVVLLAIDYAYVRFSPASHWFEYSAVTNVSAQAGEPPTFVSTNRVTKLLPMASQEELVCVFPDKDLAEQFGERFITFTPDEVADIPRVGKKWTLESAVLPFEEGLCHLEANVSMEVRYGFRKRQFVKSNDFPIDVPEM